MKKLEIITRAGKLEAVKEILSANDHHGMSVTMVSGCGLQKGRTEIYRGTEITVNLLPKVKIETVVKDESVETLIDLIVKAVKTGEIGDGKIFVYDVVDAIRIRTGERGAIAI
ncbi:MAG: P-II family nitrogen regulator [Clostridia bacterium]|nr:P-II family nitrogen regulator [Clostridia bacterium]